MSDDLSLDALTRPLTLDEARTAIYNVLAATGVNTTNWKPGAVVRTMISAVAVIVVAISTLIASVAKSGFLDLAEDSWLTLTARYVFGVERILATFASGYVTITNTGGLTFDLDPGDLIVSSSTTGKTYTNLETVHISASSTTSVLVQAQEAGESSTAFAGEIDTLVTSLLGCTVTNASALVGADDEFDPDLRARCREKLGALSPNGPQDAYAFVAKSAVLSTGEPAGVRRVRMTKDGFGNVDAYLAGVSGPILGTIGDLSTPLGAADDAMQRMATPLGVTLRTHSASAVPVDVTYQIALYATSGLTESDIQARVSDALLELVESTNVGGNIVGVATGRIYHDAIGTAIFNAVPGAITVLVSTPAGNVDLSVGEVPTLGTVTAATITQVAPEVS